MSTVKLSSRLQKLITKFHSSMISSAIWLALGAATSRGVLVVSGFVILRSFGTDLFSLYSFLIATVAIATVFSSFGLGLTATKIISDSCSRPIDVGIFIGTSRVLILTLSVVFSAVVSYGLESYAGKLIGENVFQASFFVLGAIIIYSLIGIETSILIGRKEFKIIGLVNLFCGSLQLGLIILFSFWKEFNFVLVSIIFTALLNYVFMVHNSKKSLSMLGVFPRAKITDKHFYFIVKRFSFPLFLSAIFYAPTIWLASIIIINSPNGTLSIGYFYAADNLRGVLLFFAAMISQVSLPYFSEYANDESLNQFKLLAQKVLIQVVGFTSVIVAILLIFTPLILNTYGLDSYSASLVMYIVLLSSIFVSINNVFGQILLAKHRAWEGLLINIIWSISLLVLTLSLSFANFTEIAMPVGLLLSYILIGLIQYFYISNNLGVKIFESYFKR